MELTVVSCGETAPGDTDRLKRRLAAEQWAAFYTDARGVVVAERLADQLDATLTVVEALDPDTAIRDHPGQQVLAVCDATTIRVLVAATLDVAVEGIPAPQDRSLTRVRASRRGTRSLICFNDTLHLTGVARSAPAVLETEGR